MRRILIIITFVLLAGSMWTALGPGAIEPVQRNIIYVHVPGSVCALLCFVVLLIASIGYLVTAKNSWDILAAASAEVGLVFALILNVTGSIFSRAEWNAWWTSASLRLVTSAILLLLYAVYMVLRLSFENAPAMRARICAVFGIIAFLDVPMVFISARFINDTMHRPGFSFESDWQRIAFLGGMISMIMLAGILIWIKTDLLKAKEKLQEVD